jgi:hypothetical protein
MLRHGSDDGTGRTLPEKPRTAKPFKLLAEFRPQPVQWLWEDRIPLGELTILDGDPSSNKSSLTIDLAARVSTGREMPDGTAGREGGVVLLQAEDSIRKTLLQRAKAAGADLGRIAVIERAAIPDDLDHIGDAIQQIGARLLVIDPLMCFVSHNANREQAMRQALMPLRELAERSNVAVIMVRHLNKTNGKNALYRGGGSIAIAAAVRSGFLVAKSPKDQNMRVLWHFKSNLGPLAPSLLFEPVAADDGGVRIEWRGECECSASELLASPRSDGSVRDEARRFLVDLLTDGPVEQRAVEQHAAARGLSWRTIERAKADLSVISLRKGFGLGSLVSWELPSPEPEKQHAGSRHHHPSLEAGQQPTSCTPPTPKLAVYDPEAPEREFNHEPHEAHTT